MRNNVNIFIFIQRVCVTSSIIFQKSKPIITPSENLIFKRVRYWIIWENYSFLMDGISDRQRSTIGGLRA